MEDSIAKGPEAVPDLDWGELFSVTLDAMVDGVVIMDEQGRILRVNAALERLFGWSTDDLIGERIEKLMPEPYASEHSGYVSRYLEGGEARIIGVGREVEALRRDGGTFPIDLAVGEGKIDGSRLFVGLIRDLSDRRELQYELVRRKEAIERMFDNGQIATAMTDREGRFRQVNSAWLRVAGLTEEELLARTLVSIAHPNDVAVLEQAIASLCSASAEVTIEEFSCLRPDGGTRSGALYVAAVYDDHPDEPDLVVQLVDRSQQIEAEKELRAARARLAHMNRIGTLGEMAAGIAHEVNQPLGAIANYAEAGRLVLGQRAEAPDPLDEVLEKIAVQARRAGEVIRRLRSLARGDGGGRQVVAINEQVEAAVLLAEIDPSSDAEVELDLADDLPELLVDPVQIQQVLLNLLRNGLEAEREAFPDATGRLPSLRVRTRRVNGDIEVCVRDLGAGVDPDVAREIMSPFVTTKGSGMGMGLAICQSILSSHGGRLWFEPSSDGPGTEFKFTLPIDGSSEASV